MKKIVFLVTLLFSGATNFAMDGCSNSVSHKKTIPILLEFIKDLKKEEVRLKRLEHHKKTHYFDRFDLYIEKPRKFHKN